MTAPRNQFRQAYAQPMVGAECQRLPDRVAPSWRGHLDQDAAVFYCPTCPTRVFPL